MKTIDDVREYLVDNEYEDTIIYDGPADYASAFIGVSQDGRAIYDYNLMVQSLIDEGMSEEDAVEWIDYNTAGAWIQDGPIILYPAEE